MQNWLKLTDAEKLETYNEIAIQVGLSPYAVEKDWWVTQTLNILFQTEIAPHLVFKGGTSLSKAWKLIERFSEDIDLALDRNFLGFTGTLSNTQVGKLRKKSFQYISEEFYPILKQKFKENGFENVEIKLAESKDTDQDPLIIEIYYPNVVQYPEYILPRILVEIGSRSLREPFSIKTFSSLVGEQYPNNPFADKPILIPTVNPERTFLEKIFLLHEEFQKPTNAIRVNRLSRHLYDIEKLMQSQFVEKALENDLLYKEIVNHRRTITPLRGINYDKHKPTFINPIPPEDILKDWKKDYQTMQNEMIYGDSLKFEDLIQKITTLKLKINTLDWEL